jgi:purine-binding chemotaxis protein CheW
VSTPGAGAAPSGGLVQLCTFRVGGEDYALDIMRVREIVRPLPITPVPRAPAFVDGVVHLRGEVIPVVEVRARFGLPAAPHGPRTRFLIVQASGRRLALVVDEVCEVLRLQRGEIRPAPPLVGLDAPRFFLGACGGDAAGAGRRGAAAGRLRLLLNVKALLEPTRPGEAEAARAMAEASRRA